jgi:hypothetical protein
MALLDFLNPSDEEIKQRTAQALANNGRPEELDALKKQQDLLSLPAQPLPGLGGAPAPERSNASINPEPSQVPAGRWAQKAGAQASSSNPYIDSMKEAGQIVSSLPSTGVNMQMSANKNIGDAQSQSFSDQEKVYADQEARLASSQEKLNAIQKEKQAAMDEHDKKYDEIANELKDTHIDSDRLWKNKSTGQKVLTGIGLALSAFGGPEAVARSNQIIQSAIDKDIEEQKANYGIKKQGLQDMNTVYARMMDKFNDKEKAELGMRALYIDQIKNKVDQIGARTNSKIVKENMNVLNGQLQSQKDSIVSQLGMTLASGAANAPKKYNESLPDNYTPKNEEELKRYVPGIGLATDSESAKSLKKGVEDFTTFNDSLARMIDLRKKFGSETLPTEAMGEMKQLYASLIVKKKDLAGLGVMSEQDFKLLKDMVADPAGYNPNTLSRLEKLKQEGVGQFQRKVAPNLMNPVQSLSDRFRTGKF